jgi:hypothetical protein
MVKSLRGRLFIGLTGLALPVSPSADMVRESVLLGQLRQSA